MQEQSERLSELIQRVPGIALSGGQYGHCHVPENHHWNPAYAAKEAKFVLTWNPNAAELVDPELVAMRESLPEKLEFSDEDFTMHDYELARLKFKYGMLNSDFDMIKIELDAGNSKENDDGRSVRTAQD